jgi:hypothetical protein
MSRSFRAASLWQLLPALCPLPNAHGHGAPRSTCNPPGLQTSQDCNSSRDGNGSNKSASTCDVNQFYKAIAQSMNPSYPVLSNAADALIPLMFVQSKPFTEKLRSVSLHIPVTGSTPPAASPQKALATPWNDTSIALAIRLFVIAVMLLFIAWSQKYR